MSYVDFIYKYNRYMQGTASPSEAKMNPEYRMKALQADDFGSVRSTKYSIGTNVTLKIWVVGKQLYVKKIELTGKQGENEKDKNNLIMNECSLLTSVEHGPDFQYDCTGAKIENGKLFAETIGGARFSYAINGSEIRITVDFGDN